MVAALIVALIGHGLWRLVRVPSPWPRLLLGRIGRIAGARVRIVGRPLRRDVVFLANHLSWIDILALAGATGTAFVAKAEMAGVPLIGWLCRLNHTIFVARGDRLGAARQVEVIRTALAEGWAVTIFPEGTTGDDATLLPFKSALLAAIDPPAPGTQVQPVLIDYGPETAEIGWFGDEPGLDHVRRTLRRPGGFPVTLTFLDPFVPAGGRKAVAATAHDRIASAAANP